MRGIVLIAMSAILLGACGGSEEAARVEIKAFQFSPDPIEVEAGQPVTFVNLDGTRHDVTVAGGEPELLDGKNAQTTLTFSKAGTVEYVCSLHDGPGMRGRVVVR